MYSDGRGCGDGFGHRDTCIASDLPGINNPPLPDPTGRQIARLACSTICPRGKFLAARMRSFLVPETAGRHGSKWKGRRERYGSATIVAEEAGPELALLLTRRPNTRFESSPTGLRRSGHGPTRPNERLRVLNGAQSSENAGCGTHAGFSTPPLCPCVTRARACISQVRCPVRCGGGWRKYDVALWGEGGNAGGTNGRGQDGGHQGGLVVVVVAYGLCSCRLRHRRARSFLEGSGVSNPTAGQVH